MKAMIARRHGGIAELTFVADWPEPEPEPTDVVIAVRACSLNYHDLFTLKGMPGIKVPMPIIMGIDVAGEIVAIGSAVEGWSVGDRVLVDPHDKRRGKLLGEMMDGGLAEMCRVSADCLIALPEDISFEHAAALPVAYGTAYRMMVTRGQVTAGEKVLVLGASGGVGTGAVQLAKIAGAHVIVAASSEEKLQRLYALGADEGINYLESDFNKVVAERHGKPRVFDETGGVDVVVNFTGGDTWEKSIRSLKRGGRLLNCGATAGHEVATDLRFLWSFELNILGSNGWERDDLHSLLNLVSEGRLTPEIDVELPLERAHEGFERLENRQAIGKVIIRP